MVLAPLPYTDEELEAAFPSRGLVVSPLGRGSFKVAYLAEAGGPSVVKILTQELPPEIDSTEVDAAALPERFARELRGMALASSPHVGTLTSPPQTVQIGASRYIVYEEPYYSGGTLKDRLDRGPIAADQAEELVVALLKAVKELASHDIVHRDIKPGNIMYDDIGGSPVLIDLGISLHLDMDDLTDSGEVSPNTLGYSAPEQHRARRYAQLDFRTDLFLVGIVGYYAVAGQHPLLTSDIRSRREYVVKLLSFDSIDVNGLACSDALRQVLARLLAPKPSRRYRTIDEPLQILGAL